MSARAASKVGRKSWTAGGRLAITPSSGKKACKSMPRGNEGSVVLSVQNLRVVARAKNDEPRADGGVTSEQRIIGHVADVGPLREGGEVSERKLPKKHSCSWGADREDGSKWGDDRMKRRRCKDVVQGKTGRRKW